MYVLGCEVCCAVQLLEFQVLGRVVGRTSIEKVRAALAVFLIGEVDNAPVSNDED